MLKAKVADSPHKIEQGLMFVRDMPQDEGMIFLFPSPRTLTFWGKNTFIPLDIAFVDLNDTIVKIAKIEPFCVDPISSEVRCGIAIEVNAGYFDNDGISVGDKIVIDRGSFKDDAHITFRKTTKDSASDQKKIKESQSIGVGTSPVVGKPRQDSTGAPIAIVDKNSLEQGQPEQEQNLPIVSPSDIGQYLEDDFEDEVDEQPQDGLDGNVDQQSQQDILEEPKNKTDEPKEYPVFSSAFEATEWAEKNNEVVRINYTTKRGRQIVRDVEPHGKFHSESTKREIMVSYDETVSGIRAFIMSNVGDWSFVGRQFQKKFIVKA